MDDYRKGQINAFEVSMTVICPHCHHDYYSSKSSNNIILDVKWWKNEIRTCYHNVDGKKKRCRAFKLIPFILIFHPSVIKRSII